MVWLLVSAYAAKFAHLIEVCANVFTLEIPTIVQLFPPPVSAMWMHADPLSMGNN